MRNRMEVFVQNLKIIMKKLFKISLIIIAGVAFIFFIQPVHGQDLKLTPDQQLAQAFYGQSYCRYQVLP
jgi:hypothetical protein